MRKCFLAERRFGAGRENAGIKCSRQRNVRRFLFALHSKER